MEGRVPAGLAALDDLVTRAPVRVDPLETSVRVERTLPRWRATYYFDVDADGSQGAIRVGADVFRRFSRELGVAGTEPLVAWLRARLLARSLPGLVQLVVGIDERPAGAVVGDRTRAKIYFIVQEREAALLRDLLDLFGLGDRMPAPGGGRHLFYIVGFDFDGSGLSEVKLYYALDAEHARRSMRVPGPFRALLPWVRRFAYRTTLLHPGGRQIIFDVSHPLGLWDFFEDEAARHQPGRALHAFAARMSGAMAPTRLDPCLLAVPLKDGALATEGYNVYFHTAFGPEPRPLPELQALHDRRRAGR